MTLCAKFCGKDVKECTRGEHIPNVKRGCICDFENKTRGLENESKRTDNAAARSRS